MAYQKGSDFLAKIDTAVSGGPTFTTVGSFQTSSLRINGDAVDVTNQSSPNKWRELLAGAGVKRATFSGQGVFNDSSAEGAVHTSIINGTIKLWQVIVPGHGTYQGLMQVTQYDLSNRHQGEVQYQLTLESAGDLTFTAA